MDAIEQMCLSVAHAARQWGAAEQALSTGVYNSAQASGSAGAGSLNAEAVLPPSHAIVTQQLARRTTYDLAQVVEQLSTVLLAQLACDPSLAEEAAVLDGLHLWTAKDKQAAPVQLGLAVTAALDGAYDGSKDSFALTVAMQGLGMGIGAAQTLVGGQGGSYVQALVTTALTLCPGYAQRQGQWAHASQTQTTSASDEMQW